MPVVGFDHVSLPSSDVRRLTAFYRRLGFGVVGEEEWLAGKARIVSVTFGDNKINIHPETMVTARNDTLRGPSAEPGCGDICFVWEGGHRALLELLNNIQVSPLAGPVKREGGRLGGSTPGASVYVRDPDQNLLEFISYDKSDLACL